MRNAGLDEAQAGLKTTWLSRDQHLRRKHLSPPSESQLVLGTLATILGSIFLSMSALPGSSQSAHLSLLASGLDHLCSAQHCLPTPCVKDTSRKEAEAQHLSVQSGRWGRAWLLQVKVCSVWHQGAPSGNGGRYKKDSTDSLLSHRSISGDSKQGVSFGCLSPIHGWVCDGLAGMQGHLLISPRPHPSRPL